MLKIAIVDDEEAYLIYLKKVIENMPIQYDIGCGFVIDSSYYFEISLT